jgi:hypothetical protein
MTTTETKYDVDYFIKKFEAIPEENWTSGVFERSDGSRCALGHCGRLDGCDTPEANALDTLLSGDEYGGLTPWINDVLSDLHPQPTPKQRILAALRDIKAKQEAK